MVFAQSVDNDGFEEQGGQARFLVKPANGRWYLADWEDVPSPAQGMVGTTTWGSIKNSFL